MTDPIEFNKFHIKFAGHSIPVLVTIDPEEFEVVAEKLGYVKRDEDNQIHHMLHEEYLKRGALRDEKTKLDTLRRLIHAQERLLVERRSWLRVAARLDELASNWSEAPVDTLNRIVAERVDTDGKYHRLVEVWDKVVSFVDCTPGVTDDDRVMEVVANLKRQLTEANRAIAGKSFEIESQRRTIDELQRRLTETTSHGHEVEGVRYIGNKETIGKLVEIDRFATEMVRMHSAATDREHELQRQLSEVTSDRDRWNREHAEAHNKAVCQQREIAELKRQLAEVQSELNEATHERVVIGTESFTGSLRTINKLCELVSQLAEAKEECAALRNEVNSEVDRTIEVRRKLTEYQSSPPIPDKWRRAIGELCNIRHENSDLIEAIGCLAKATQGPAFCSPLGCVKGATRNCLNWLATELEKAHSNG